jgi:sterol desaturase/sphingolipid hydroxylase (fatty acid hydroxylase superfamily)
MNVPVIVLSAAAVMMGVELLRPGRRWPEPAGWWARAALLNGLQAGMVFLGGRLWEPWLRESRLWSADGLGVAGGALAGYLAVTFVYYWWHRWRHESAFLWRWLHQLHHSAQRIEVVTSFYKHPLEIASNGVLSSAILYLLVGVGPEAASYAVLLTGLAELFYHWNVRTPRWLGYIIQRPESHCYHHGRGIHAMNYADLPLWDMLFGTFHNPETWEAECGLGAQGEQRLGDLLLGADVSGPPRPRRRTLRAAWALLLLGLAQMFGDLAGLPGLKALAGASAASPAPKVFCAVRGYETISTKVRLEVLKDGRWEAAPFLEAGRLKCPYNRRNVYGAALAYAPVMEPGLRRAVWRHGLCGEARLLDEAGLQAYKGFEKRLVYTQRDGRESSFPVECL